jgi:hypothetical protein
MTLRFAIAVAAFSAMTFGHEPSRAAAAGPIAPQAVTAQAATGNADLEQVQYRRGYVGPPRGYYAPRPGFYGPPRYYGPPRVYGGPVWGYRPWYRRPYYGTIIAGVALGTIVAATAYGLAPRPPRPDLCWYWADEIQSRGYWDYC